MKVFILSTCLTTLDKGELVVNHTVTARTTRRRRPWRSLTLGCITLVGIFFKKDLI